MFQVYHYEHSNMVYDVNNKQYVLPTAEECELCLGIDKFYTLSCVKEHFESRDTFIKRRQLLGNSFNCSVIAFLLTHWLHDRSYQRSIPPVDICCNTIVCNKPFMAEPSATAPTASSDETAVTLVKEYMRIAEKGGSDVRLELGVPFRPNAWPRAGAQVHRWNWSIVHGFPWRNSTNVHINKLELLVVLSTIKWRTRRASQQRSRFIHLVDSQVVGAIVTKGRTSSRNLRPTVLKTNALILAAQIYPCYIFVHSEDNPADLPSRFAWSNERRRKRRRTN